MFVKQARALLSTGFAAHSVDIRRAHDTRYGQRSFMKTFILALLLTMPCADLLMAATLDRVRETGALRLGFRADAKPYSYRDAKGQPAGYIVDLCREVAEQLGVAAQASVRPQYVPVTPAQRFEAIRQGKIDILCDPASVTMERRTVVDFSIPTFLDGTSVLYRRDHPIQSFEELAGRRVGVLKGTTTADNLFNGMRLVKVQAQVTQVADHRQGLDLLLADKIDAYFGDRAILASLLYEGGLPGIELGRRYFSYETYALGLPYGDDAFRLAVDRALAELYRSGKVRTLLSKTFGSPPHDTMLDALIAIHSFPER
jgi:polar amino acid transport system substrate-binding protein/glutamate/aspartate transport system substrate-binding protein